MAETWKRIPDIDAEYYVSNMGRVRSETVTHGGYVCKRTKYINGSDNGNGYLYITVLVKGKKKHLYIHRLVADLFVENISGGDVVNHLDYDKHNNNADNLEWCTQKENIIHSINHMRGKIKNCKTNTGEHHISRDRNGHYRVSFGKVVTMFDYIDEAKIYRDKYINEKCIAR